MNDTGSHTLSHEPVGRPATALVSVTLLAVCATLAVCLAPAAVSAQLPRDPPPSSSHAAASPCFDNVNRYVDCGDGTVTDTVTGLVWLKQAGCLGRVDWATGATLAASLAHGTCGLSDGSRPGQWRLPTLAEWQATIARAVAMGCTLEGPGTPPALTNDAGTACLATGPTSFSTVDAGGYWTLTVNDQHPNNAWVASLSGTIHGFVFSAVKTFELPAWPVRDR